LSRLTSSAKGGNYGGECLSDLHELPFMNWLKHLKYY